MNKLTIAHISDTHLTPAGAIPAHHQQVSPATKLQLIFDDLQATVPSLDLVVISGDLIHEGTADDYQRLQVYLAEQSRRLQVPVQVLLGNHDDREAFFAGYLHRSPTAYYAHCALYQNMAFYFLDTKWGQKREAGRLGADQLAWLNKNLHLAPKRRSFIFQHHPLDTPGLRDMRYSILQNNRDELACLHGHNIGGIFAGHIHFETSYQVDATIPVTTVGAAAYYIDCAQHRHTFRDATSYNLITIQRGNAIVTQRPLLFRPTIIDELTVKQTGFVKPPRDMLTMSTLPQQL